MIEELLKKLAKDGRSLVLVKANNGYSAVISPFYADIILLNHHNGETIDDAIKQLVEKEKD